MQGAVSRTPAVAHARRRVRGTSLVEVLVSLIVISVALVGAAGVQIKAMKFGQVSQQRSIAVQHAGAIAERMRANLAASAMVTPSPYEFNFAYSEIPTRIQALESTAVTCTTDCTPQQMAQRQLVDWQSQLKQGLTGGRGTIARTANAAGSPFVVTVMWVEKEMVDSQRSLNCPATAPSDVQCVSLRFQP